MSRTATAQSPAGSFATSRRGTVGDDARFIYSQRARGVSIQHIAHQTGRSSIDVSRFLNPTDEDLAPKEERWPFGACDASVQAVVRSVCKQAVISLQDIHNDTTSHRVWRVRRAIYSALRHRCPGMSFEEIGSVFGRDKKVIMNGAYRHDAENRQVSS